MADHTPRRSKRIAECAAAAPAAPRKRKRVSFGEYQRMQRRLVMQGAANQELAAQLEEKTVRYASFEQTMQHIQARIDTLEGLTQDVVTVTRWLNEDAPLDAMPALSDGARENNACVDAILGYVERHRAQPASEQAKLKNQ